MTILSKAIHIVQDSKGVEKVEKGLNTYRFYRSTHRHTHRQTHTHTDILSKSHSRKTDWSQCEKSVKNVFLAAHCGDDIIAQTW